MIKIDLEKRRRLINPGNKEDTINYCIDQFLRIGNEAIKNHGAFYVALSGGSTPKAIFQGLKLKKNSLDWSKIYVFWSDERAVSPNHQDSNYKMAMDSGIKELSIPKEQIFRMVAETDIENNALNYETLIKKIVPNAQFDLVMLGMGDDGHTASLFPKTHGLHTENKLVTANFIPKFDTWRLSFTFECINQAKNISIYILGSKKSEILKTVLESPYNPDLYPIQKIGSETYPCTLIVDNDAFLKTKKTPNQ